MIKSTKHSLLKMNKNKYCLYLEFLKEYRRVAQFTLDYLWENSWTWKNLKGEYLTLNIKEDQLNCPQFLDRRIIDIIGKTTLSARSIKCCTNQVCGAIKYIVEERSRQLFTLKNKYIKEEIIQRIKENIKKKLTKPNLKNINPELNTICCDVRETPIGHFNAFIRLKSIGDIFGHIRIPIKYHSVSNKWKAKGKIMTSFLFAKKYISIRWKVEKPEERQYGAIVGADQGLTTVLTLSNKNTTPQQDIHRHSLVSITKKLVRKRKGSKSFKKVQAHRENFINWSINQLSLDNIKTIKMEEIVNIGKGKRLNRFLSHWRNTLIRDKVVNRCEELGVQVIFQSPTYRSQRCSQCGLVRKASRKGKEFKCLCGFVCDADLNASINHEQELPDVSYILRKLKKNRGAGFYWKPGGFFETTGEEIIVPSSKNKKIE